MKPVLFAVVLCAAPAVAAADRAAIGTLDVWDGPFDSIADATARDLSPATEVDDGEQHVEAIRARKLPIEDLVALRRHVVDCASNDPDCHDRETLEYRLAVRTHAGWYMSAQLGVSQNRDRCDITVLSGSSSRFTIGYRCDVGRFDWASKEFVLLCGVDTTGRVACGRTLVDAHHNVHSGGKSDTAIDVLHHTLSCGTKVAGDTVRIVPRKVTRPIGHEGRYIEKLAKCRGATRFPLGGSYTPGAHPPPPLFDYAGRWLDTR